MFKTTLKDKPRSFSHDFPRASLQIQVDNTADTHSLNDVNRSTVLCRSSELEFIAPSSISDTTFVEKPEVVQNSSDEEPNGRRKNPFVKVIHSFKRSKEVDPETGDVQLNQKLDGFTLQMICVGGSIGTLLFASAFSISLQLTSQGTGLFIGQGAVLKSGPIILILSNLIVSSFIYCMCQSIAELSINWPSNSPRSIINFCTKLIGKNISLVVSTNYAIQWSLLLPLELVAATMVFEFWPVLSQNIPKSALITIFYFVIAFMNLLDVKFYGIAENVFSIIKLSAIILFFIIGLLINFGVLGDSKETIGFKNWRNPGMIAPNGFKYLIPALITSVFSFAGSELIGISSGESKDIKNVSKATKQVFWRICIFYFCSLLLISILVPYNDPMLLGGGSDVNSSPFVLALGSANTDLFAHSMNIVILVSILSVGNSAIYASSRTMLSLAQNGQVPSFINYVDKKKRPLIANLISLSFGVLAYISLLSKNTESLFTWLVSISGNSILFTFGSICFCHIRFRKWLQINQVSYKEEFYFTSPVGVYGAWYGFLFSILVIIAQFYDAIFPANSNVSVGSFLKKTLGIIIILTLLAVTNLHQYLKYGDRSILVELSQVNINEGVFRNSYTRELNRSEVKRFKEAEKTKPVYKKITSFWC